MISYYENTHNGKIRKVEEGFNWKVFLFGSVYLAYKGMWGHAILTVIVVMFTLWTYYIIPLAMWIYVGFKFNEWYREHLISEGFKKK